MNEFIMVLLKTIATAAASVCAAYLVAFLRRKSEQAIAQTENVKTKQLMESVTDAVCTAVTYTSQTYVDALKRSDGFNKEAQRAAFERSLAKAKSLLSEAVIFALDETYGDAESYLTSRIEAEVRNQKGAAHATPE